MYDAGYTRTIFFPIVVISEVHERLEVQPLEDAAKSPPRFTVRGEVNESICMRCYRTVRIDEYTDLGTAEKRHACSPLDLAIVSISRRRSDIRTSAVREPQTKGSD
jgi:hypothetical protein